MHTLRMTTAQAASLRRHLLDGSGLEAVSIALCGRAGHESRTTMTVHRIVHVPHAECVRHADGVRWPTSGMKALLEEAARGGMGLLRIHSHPDGFAGFSDLDDRSDLELFDAVDLRVPGLHASAIMLPDGSMLARRLLAGQIAGFFDRVAVVGHDLLFHDRRVGGISSDFDLRHRQLFGDATTDLLARLSVAVVGVSGTGSPTVEMLARLGVGRIVLVEFDKVEGKNLNRIWGSTCADAERGALKAFMMRDHLARIGLGTEVEVHACDVAEPSAIAAVATCDMLFGCVDSVLAREVMSRISAFHTLPYLDMGVRLDADGRGGVRSVSAGVHWLVPGGSSLRTRGVYDGDDVYAAQLHRDDPAFYADQLRRGYVRGVAVDSPSVISINAATAAAAVNEFLARLHPFRTSGNEAFAINKLLFSHGRVTQRPDREVDAELASWLGRGEAEPPLMSALVGARR